MAMIKLSIHNDTSYKHDKEYVLTILKAIESIIEFDSEVTLSLAFISNKEMHKQNLNYAGVDATTDVLSFVEKEVSDEFQNRFFTENYLGEILIAVGVLKQQAQKHNNSIEKELALLLIHGFLHIMGHDHGQTEEAKEMKAMEVKIMNKLLC